jgi:hypothetical protein
MMQFEDLPGCFGFASAIEGFILDIFDLVGEFFERGFDLFPPDGCFAACERLDTGHY